MKPQEQAPHNFLLGEWLVQPRLNELSRDGRRLRVEPKVMEVPPRPEREVLAYPVAATAP